MKANKHTVHIDQALIAKLEQYDNSYKGDYSAFKQALSMHSSNYVLLDDVLEMKLGQSAFKLESSWKQVAAVLWYRRLRNASIVIIVLFGLSFGFRYAINIQQSSSAQKSGSVRHSVPEMKDSGKRTIKNENRAYHMTPMDEYSNRTIRTGRRQAYFDKTVLNNNNGIHNHGLADILLFDGHLNILTDLGSESQLKRSEILGISIDSVAETVASRRLSALNHIIPASLIRKRFSVFRGLTIGIEISNSFQNSHSFMGNPDPEYTNRNYEALTDNGRRVSHVVNFGISVEKMLLKGLGISAGLQKQTLNQTQITDFMLTEAPVYDLDGRIAGYIQIVPEKINVRLGSTVSYLAVPLYLTYNQNINANNSFQLKLGVGLMYQIHSETEKFDYKSLDLKPYQNSANRLTMRQARYGLGWTRQIGQHTMLSLAMERQAIDKIPALSDPTERIQTITNNVILSLKYKL